LERFLSWEQISSVIAEGILTEDLIRESFRETILSKRLSAAGRSFGDPFSQSPQQEPRHHSLESAEGEGEGDGQTEDGILFDEFCVLMEQLEYLVAEKEEEDDQENKALSQCQPERAGLASVREGEEEEDSNSCSSDEEEDGPRGPEGRSLNIIRRRRQSVRLIEL
jgi:hypothetical protein